MIKNKLKHFFKTYFYFSAKERNGIIALLMLMLMISMLPTLYGKFFPPNLNQLKIEVLQKTNPFDTVAIFNNQENNNTYLKQDFTFDPNTADDETWMKLGLKKYQIKILRNYQKANGKFNKPDDLRKLHSIDSQQYLSILPYIKIASKQTYSTLYKTQDTIRQTRKKVQYPIDLNSADSETIVSLYGIGPKMASKIINYRNSLGGFLSLNQLNDIYMFNEDLLFDLKGKIYVDSNAVTKFNLNKVKLETLQNHPYFKFRLSKVIINYRDQHGAFHSLNDLRKIVIITDSVYNRIVPYLYVKQ
jgi:DNA uptake protein ComE-like DNA-binding protein